VRARRLIDAARSLARRPRSILRQLIAEPRMRIFTSRVFKRRRLVPSRSSRCARPVGARARSRRERHSCAPSSSKSVTRSCPCRVCARGSRRAGDSLLLRFACAFAFKSPFRRQSHAERPLRKRSDLARMSGLGVSSSLRLPLPRLICAAWDRSDGSRHAARDEDVPFRRVPSGLVISLAVSTSRAPHRGAASRWRGYQRHLRASSTRPATA